MRVTRLVGPDGVRAEPEREAGGEVATGALVLAGSSGRVDEARVRLLAAHGVLAESVRWFGGPGQHEGPWEIPLELFQERVDDLARHCERVVLVGTSFGAEAALATAAVTPHVDAVVAFAPSDVVWAGVRPDGSQTSHWTLDGEPLPFVPFTHDWVPDTDPPSFRDLYLRSRAASPERAAAARIAVERIARVVLVAGGDDQVWPSLLHAEEIARRRATHGLPTTVVRDPQAGHRVPLPGEPPASAGVVMRRGGTPEADRRLGARAWSAVAEALGLDVTGAGAGGSRTRSG